MANTYQTAGRAFSACLADSEVAVKLIDIGRAGGSVAGASTNESLVACTMDHCSGCGRGIVDKYLLRIRSELFHERCAVCCVCHGSLQDSCFVRDGKLFCRYDYAKLHGTCCSGCGYAIVTSELVMRAQNLVYHVQCFACATCAKHLRKGDQFALRDGQLMCRVDYEREMMLMHPAAAAANTHSQLALSANIAPLVALSTAPLDMRRRVGASDDDDDDDDESSAVAALVDDDSDSDCTGGGGRGGSKRPRTILSAAQRRKFKQVFEVNPKPSRKVRESLSSEAGLSVRVVQVWFQNQRAKVKKVARRQTGGSVVLPTHTIGNAEHRVDDKRQDRVESLSLETPAESVGTAAISSTTADDADHMDKLYSMQSTYFI